MTILVFGIPGAEFEEYLLTTYPADSTTVYYAESRPFEETVSDEITKLVDAGYNVILISDNMIAYTLQHKDIHEVVIFQLSQTDTHAVCQPGSHMVAILADETGTSCRLLPAGQVNNKPIDDGVLKFHGLPLTFGNVGNIPYLNDSVPLNLVLC